MLAYFSLFLSLISGVLSCELCRHDHLPLPLKSSGRVGSVQLDWFTVAHFLTTRRIFAVLRVSELFEACCQTLLLQTAQETETFSFPNFFLQFLFCFVKQLTVGWNHILPLQTTSLQMETCSLSSCFCTSLTIFACFSISTLNLICS